MYKYAQAIYEKAHDAADALKELVNRADEKLIDLQCYDHSKEPIYANVWDSFDGREVCLHVKALMVTADVLWVCVDQQSITYSREDFLSDETADCWYSLDGMSGISFIPTVYNICESINDYIENA